MKFNGVENYVLALRHCGEDIYSFISSSRDVWFVNDMSELNSYGFALLELKRNTEYICMSL